MYVRILYIINIFIFIYSNYFIIMKWIKKEKRIEVEIKPLNKPFSLSLYIDIYRYMNI